MVLPDEPINGLRLLRWDGFHEVSQSRKVKGPLPWVAIPTQQGKGYCRLMAKHQAVGLGVWCALVERAAARSAGKRGQLDGTLEDIALVTRVPIDQLREVLPTLLDLEWVEVSRESDATTMGARSQSATTPMGATDGEVVTTTADRLQPSTNGRDTTTMGARSDHDGGVVAPTDGRTDAQDGTENPLPPSGNPRLLRRFLRRGTPPQGYSGWAPFFADLAISKDIGGEEACRRWLVEQGGSEALKKARKRGLVA